MKYKIKISSDGSEVKLCVYQLKRFLHSTVVLLTTPKGQED